MYRDSVKYRAIDKFRYRSDLVEEYKLQFSAPQAIRVLGKIRSRWNMRAEEDDGLYIIGNFFNSEFCFV